MHNILIVSGVGMGWHAEARVRIDLNVEASKKYGGKLLRILLD